MLFFDLSGSSKKYKEAKKKKKNRVRLFQWNSPAAKFRHVRQTSRVGPVNSPWTSGAMHIQRSIVPNLVFGQLKIGDASFFSSPLLLLYGTWFSDGILTNAGAQIRLKPGHIDVPFIAPLPPNLHDWFYVKITGTLVVSSGGGEDKFFHGRWLKFGLWFVRGKFSFSS